MPFVSNQGIRIHYRTEGEGEPLLLHHGFMQWLELWQQTGYVKALKDRYRLILMDGRGHGASDKPHDPAAYAFPLRVQDILCVLDVLDIPKVHYWGYSMGGRIGFGFAQTAPERVLSLILGGTHPYAESFSPFEGLDGTDPEAFIQAFETVLQGERLSATARAMVLKNDLRALVAATISRDSLEPLLPTMHMPCLIYAGEEDFRYERSKTCVAQLPNAHFVGLKGLNHATGFSRSQDILPHALTHLEQASRYPSRT